MQVPSIMSLLKPSCLLLTEQKLCKWYANCILCRCCHIYNALQHSQGKKTAILCDVRWRKRRFRQAERRHWHLDRFTQRERQTSVHNNRGRRASMKMLRTRAQQKKKKLQWKKLLCRELQLDFSLCVWLHFHFILLRKKWWKWLMKTVQALTGMIKFGIEIAARWGGCAYFTRFTFRSRLQVFDWHALLGYPRKNTHHALRKHNHRPIETVQRASWCIWLHCHRSSLCVWAKTLRIWST